MLAVAYELFTEVLKLSPAAVMTYPTWILMVLLSLSYGSYAWTQRPGDVFVCEGQTALLLWDYDHTIGEFNEAHVYKDGEYLLGITREKVPQTTDDRIDGIENSTSGFQIKNITPSDNGNYKIEIYLSNPALEIQDSASLHVLKSEDCPEKETQAYEPSITPIQETTPVVRNMSSPGRRNFDASAAAAQTTASSVTIGVMILVHLLVTSGCGLFKNIHRLIKQDRSEDETTIAHIEDDNIPSSDPATSESATADAADASELLLKSHAICNGMQKGGEEVNTLAEVENGNIRTSDPMCDEDDQ